MSDYAVFLGVRLDEDEAAAKAATPGPWMTGRGIAHLVDNVIYGEGTWPGHIQQAANVDYAEHKAGNAAHIARHDPSRALREVAASRRILGRHGDCGHGGYCDDGGFVGPGPCPDLADRLAIYSDHPDYDQEWAAP